jgi:putative intracellular protease/amidase
VAAGFTLDTPVGLERLDEADLVAVPAIAEGHPRLRRQDYPEPLLAALRRTVARGGRVLSVCTGAFVLGAAGLLDGRRCTTHWRNVSDLALCCPAADVDPSVLYVDADPVITSAGTAAGIDACLYLVRKEHGSKVANAIARRMVVPPHRDGGQAQYIDRPLPTTSAPGSTPHRTRTGARSASPAPPRGRHESAAPAGRSSCWARSAAVVVHPCRDRRVAAGKLQRVRGKLGERVPVPLPRLLQRLPADDLAAPDQGL